jgi:hypothetical protein
MQSSKRAGPEAIVKQGVPPKLNIKKIGIVSRDYRCEFPNGRRDFSHVLPEVLKLLDRNGCDAAVFSLFSIVSQESHGLSNKFARLRLRRIKAIFLEEFRDWPKKKKRQREAERNVVYHCSKGKWLEYEYHQKVSRGNDPRTRILSFVSDEMPKRSKIAFTVLWIAEPASFQASFRCLRPCLFHSHSCAFQWWPGNTSSGQGGNSASKAALTGSYFCRVAS